MNQDLDPPEGADPEVQSPDGAAHRAPAPGLRARFTRGRVLGALAVLVVLVLGAGFGVGPGDGFFHATEQGAATIRATAPTGTAPSDDADATDEPAVAGQSIRSYAGLCRDFQTEALTNGSVASDPAFAPLAKDAGGQSKIKTYCQELLGTPTSTPGAGEDQGATSSPTPTATSGTTPGSSPGGGSTGSPATSAPPTVSVTPSPTAKPSPSTSPTPTVSASPTRPGGKPTKTAKP